MEILYINGELSLPLAELQFSFDHSSGPGGQNVNKVHTRAELRFDVLRSPSLSAEQRRRLESALQSRLTREGVLIVRSSRFRTQGRNRQDCLEKMSALLAAHLRPPPPRRRRTRPGRAAVERRLQGKKLRAGKKNLRRRPSLD